MTLLCVFFISTLWADIRLPALVADSMVLQRDTELKIWGWADPGEKVKVSFHGERYSSQADPEGRWFVILRKMKAGGPFTMEISGSNTKITLRNILVGDVYLCAGQSNMVHSLALHQQRYQEEIRQANYPAIRQFLVPVNALLRPDKNARPNGQWKGANPKNVLDFSVVAYFFAKNLYDEYQVPIGLINASVGGTPIEAWISEEGLNTFSDLTSVIQRNKDSSYVNTINRAVAAETQKINASRQSDLGMTSTIKWFDTLYRATDWRPISLPGYWEDQGLRNLDGVVWYRKEISVPQAFEEKPAVISLGRIVDADYVYINGTLVGNKTYQYPQRRYTIPAGILKRGKNNLVVRVINYSGKGGFVPDKPYYIATDNDTIDLTGYWKYQVGEVYSQIRSRRNGIVGQNQPSALYNGMVAPFINYKLSGILWYQGESNTHYPETYEKLLPALIHDWRRKWEQEKLPFLYAQLPNFMEIDYSPSESQWASLRNAQLKTLRIPQTAMAVTIDLGEWNDIHPGNKKPIGDRLALAAKKIVYGKDVVYSGPVYASSRVNGNQVILTFNHLGSGIISLDGQPLRWFALAGEDKKFYWAKAEIKDNQVHLSSELISNPVYVRYAWADNPEGVNFYNKEILPASPFEIRVAEEKLWQGKKAGIVLTYDDGLASHLDKVIPALNHLGLRATFYLSAGLPGVTTRINDWRDAAKNGHELGNHTLYHPCDASKPGRSWVSPENDLSRYTQAQLVREVTMTNSFLQAVDGKSERTFAYTCGDTSTGDGPFIEAIKKQFVSMRGVDGRLNTLATLNLNNINCYVVDERNSNQLKGWAEKAKQENALLVILFHGVGGDHAINIDQEVHDEFLSFLKEHSEDYWVTTMLEASNHCIQYLKK